MGYDVWLAVGWAMMYGWPAGGWAMMNGWPLGGIWCMVGRWVGYDVWLAVRAICRRLLRQAVNFNGEFDANVKELYA